MSKNRLKVGDVVHFDPNNHAGWGGVFKMNTPYRIEEINISLEKPGLLCCSLVDLNGERPIKNTNNVDTQPWDCWLIKDDFMSAVHQRKEKRKRAAKV